MEIWVSEPDPSIGNKTGFLDVRPDSAAQALIDVGIAQRANEGGHRLIKEDTAIYHGWQGFVTISASAPSNLTAPVITGDAGIGQTLTMSDGTWDGTGLTFAYRWYQNGTPIIGETANTYIVRPEDYGSMISGHVVAINSAGRDSATSNIVTIRLSQYSYATTTNQLPTPGEVYNASGSLYVRINITDADGINHSSEITTLSAGSTITIGSQVGILASQPGLNGNVAQVPMTAWPLLADGSYLVKFG